MSIVLQIISLATYLAAYHLMKPEPIGLIIPKHYPAPLNKKETNYERFLKIFIKFYKDMHAKHHGILILLLITGYPHWTTRKSSPNIEDTTLNLL